MTSDKQTVANRKNALQSRGPKTEEGKAVVSKNALKHGILSRHVVLENEDKGEFRAVREAFRADLKPVGVVEEMLVERIVTSYWRLQRVLVAESGATKEQNNKWYERVKDKLKEASKFKSFENLYDYKSEKTSNSIYTQMALSDLERLTGIVEEIGYLPDEERDKYAEMVSIRADMNDAGMFYTFCEMAKGGIEGEDKDKGKKALLYVLDKDIETAKSRLKAAKIVEDEVDEANRMLAMVPNGETAEKLSRYETGLERSMYQALAMLGKLREGKLTE